MRLREGRTRTLPSEARDEKVIYRGYIGVMIQGFRGLGFRI